MVTYEFQYISAIKGDKWICIIEDDEEVLKVTVNGNYSGTLIKDKSKEFGFTTEDELLKPELEGLTMAMKEEDAITNFPIALKILFGNAIIDWDFDSNDNLILILADNVHLQTFATHLVYQLKNVVLFSKPLMIYLKQNAGGYLETPVNKFSLPKL